MSDGPAAARKDGTDRTADEPHALVYAKNRLFDVGSKALIGAGALLGVADLDGHVLRSTGLLALYVVLGGVAAALAVRRNYRPRKVRAHVRLGGDGVTVDGALRVPRAAIASGFYQPRGADEGYRSSVKLVNRFGNVVFEMEVEHEGHAMKLLRALALDPNERRAELRAASPIFATGPRQLAFMFVIVLLGAPLLRALDAVAGTSAPFGPELLAPIVLLAMLPSRIVVGVDGILMRWLWTKRFIPMADVRSVRREGDRAICLVHENGREEILWTSMRGKNRSKAQVEHRDAVLARLEWALRSFRAREPHPDVSAILGRGGRAHDAWIAELRRLGRAEGGYRDAFVRDEDLWRVLEDPAAPEDARAGAAYVLRGDLDDGGKQRVRVAAEATASPRLRVALEAEDEADAEGALAHLAQAGRDA